MRHSVRSARSVGVSPETVRIVRMNLGATNVVKPQPPAPSPPQRSSWNEDRALVSSDQGEEFVAWFDRTTVTREECWRFADSVPLSRIYEISDEAGAADLRSGNSSRRRWMRAGASENRHFIPASSTVLLDAAWEVAGPGEPSVRILRHLHSEPERRPLTFFGHGLLYRADHVMKCRRHLQSAQRRAGQCHHGGVWVSTTSCISTGDQ